MKVSVIVSVYKDVEALALIIEALKRQTYTNFEVVIVEDGESKEMKKYIDTLEGISFKHTTQKDMGVRKARSQNNGILASSGEYLIFIDGDCIPYSTFIDGHAFLAKEKRVLSGRRVNLPATLSKEVRNGTISSYAIEKSFYKYFTLLLDKSVRYKQGIYLNPRGLFYQLVAQRQISTSILGCNFSCFKKDILDINGFDESYGGTAVSDDMDLEWRFLAAGYEVISCKNVANMFHLDHKANARPEATQQVQKMNKRKEKNQFICSEGLNTHA